MQVADVVARRSYLHEAKRRRSDGQRQKDPCYWIQWCSKRIAPLYRCRVCDKNLEFHLENGMKYAEVSTQSKMPSFRLPSMEYQLKALLFTVP